MAFPRVRAGTVAGKPDRWNDLNNDERGLDETALDDAARYVVQVAPELPGFQSRFADRVVQHLQSVTEDLDKMLLHRREKKVGLDTVARLCT